MLIIGWFMHEAVTACSVYQKGQLCIQKFNPYFYRFRILKLVAVDVVPPWFSDTRQHMRTCRFCLEQRLPPYKMHALHTQVHSVQRCIECIVQHVRQL